MVNNFKGYESTGITAETTVYTGPASTQVTVIGLSVSNTRVNAAKVSIKKNGAYIVKDATVIAGSALIAIGGDQKLVVEPSNTITVTSDQTVDVVLSALEIS